MPRIEFTESATLDYSDEATNTLDVFMECDYILFVEGEDDVLFWNTIFDQCSSLKVDIRPVGGVNELKPYLEKIINGTLGCLVAKDADYNIRIGEIRHPRILCTYGYSIENTLYSSKLIAAVLKVWSKSPIDTQEKIESWLTDLVEHCTPLFHLDFVNAKRKLEIDTGAGHCQRFMTSKTSEHLDKQKILNHVDGLIKQHGLSMSAEEISSIQHVPTLVLMRGHFLQSAILRYINSQLKIFGRKTNVSADALYAHAIHFFQSCFDWSSLEGRHYSDQVATL